MVSSPVQRARETAAPLAAALGIEVAIDAALDELDFGAWAGASFAELDSQPAWHGWNRARSFAVCPGGESMVAAQSRALAGLARLHARYPEGEVAVVSHSDILKSMLAHFLGVPLDLFQRLTLDPASRSVLVLSGTEVRVDGVNLGC